MQKIAIVANGKLSKSLLNNVRKVDYVIGVDRGAYWLIANGITPNIAIGDFDSVSLKELEEIKKRTKTVKKYPSEKDATDLEIAIDHAISLHPKEVIIYGVSGGRLDHTLTAIQLLTKLLSNQIQAVIRDDQNEIIIISKRQVLLQLKKYKYLSVLPLGKQVIVSLKGFKYEVSNRTIVQGSTLGVSNEIIHEYGIIEVHEGVAVVIYSRDR